MNNILNCSRCNKRIDVPKILPCGATVCSYCALIEPVNDRFKCPVCKELHWFPKDDFPINNALLDLVSHHSEEITHSQDIANLNENLNLIQNHIDILTTGLLNGGDQIREHCAELRSQVTLATESIMKQLTEVNNQYMNRINEYEQDCLITFESKSDKLEFKRHTEAEFVPMIERLRVFHSAWSEFVN